MLNLSKTFLLLLLVIIRGLVKLFYSAGEYKATLAISWNKSEPDL